MKLSGLLLALGTSLAAVTAQAQSFDRVVQAEVLPGWRTENGDHMAALRITLNPGWKTYWRAPGDAGIPPLLDWSGSGNLESAEVTWPTPEVFSQNGMRSIGYTEELVLPVRNGAGALIAVFDIDSDLPAAFTKDDAAHLQAILDATFKDAA